MLCPQSTWQAVLILCMLSAVECPEVNLEGGEASNIVHTFPASITLYCYEGKWFGNYQFSRNIRCTEMGEWQPELKNCTGGCH